MFLRFMVGESRVERTLTLNEWASSKHNIKEFLFMQSYYYLPFIDICVESLSSLYGTNFFR